MAQPLEIKNSPHPDTILRWAIIENIATLCAITAIIIGVYAEGGGGYGFWALVLTLNFNTGTGAFRMLGGKK